MRRIMKMALVLVFTVCVLALSAAAAKVDYRFEPVEDYGYDLVMNVQADTAISTFATNIIFNTNKLALVDGSYNVVAPTDETAGEAFYAINHSTSRNPIQYIIMPVRYTAKEPAGMYMVELACGQESVTAAKLDFANGFDVAALAFSLVGDTQLTDITPDDLKIEMIFLGVHNEAKDVYGYNSPDANLVVEYTNSAVTEPKTETITVPAGSSVYFQDGTHNTYDVETQVEINVDNAGYVVVNTGYTAQTIYKVADGALTTASTNALLGSDYTEIRTREPAGVRYKAIVTDAGRDALAVKEYGFLVAVETSKLEAGYHLDMDLVAEGKAKKGVAFNETTNIVFNYDAAAEATTFTAVVHGVDTTSKAQLTTPIAVRSYMITADGAVVYGKITRSTVYDTAVAIKTAGGEAYTANKDFIDAVIKTVEPDEEPVDTKDNFIDISDLYAD